MAFDRTYQPGGSFTPVGVGDGVWWEYVPGFGWVERTAQPVTAEVEDECQGAA